MKADWKAPNYSSGERRGGTVIAEYIYRDKDGEPYLKVERTEDKQFPQYHWVKGSLDRKSHWESGAAKGPKIPYMLPQLMKHPPEEPLFIAEGEKDAETVIDLGLMATTNPGGAGKWTADLNKYFKGLKTVVVLEDNDTYGRRHALKVARNLVGIVKEVRIVTFQELSEGGDVSDWIAAGHTKEELLALAAATPVFKKKATIKIIAGEGSRALDELIVAMKDAQCPVLVRAGKVVQPIWAKRPAAKGRETKMTALQPMTVSNLRYMINKHAVIFMAWNKGDKAWVPIDPPDKLLLMLLELGHTGFPQVFGTISAPTMRPCGSILNDPGYDVATHLWYEPAGDFTLPDIPPKPSKEEDARPALEILKGLLVEVLFKDKAVDQSVALAAILTAVLRGGFDLAPLFLFLAHVAGTGKSFLVDLIAVIVTGRYCPVITGHKTIEEMEKRLGSLLLEGPPLISIDNLSNDLEGAMLCHMVERPLVKVRILGKSETPECEWRGVLFATGNNINLVGDMTRRGLICNLDAKIERPELRTFKHDPLAMVLADRGKYIAAALTIARAYLISGERVKCDPLGSYGAWARFVREPLMWLGEKDPVISMDQARADDPARVAQRELIEQCGKHLGTKEAYKSSQIIDVAKETRPAKVMGAGLPDYERVRPEFYALLMEHAGNARGTEIDPKRLGNLLKDAKGKVHLIDGKNYRIVTVTESSSHGNRWRLEEWTPGA